MRGRVRGVGLLRQALLDDAADLETGQMSTVQTFRMPDSGEGLTEAEIVRWLVKPGDVVRVNDVLVEIETATR